MYRYHQHLMNDENWNRDIKKPARLPAEATHEQTIHDNTANEKTINSSAAPVSETMNPLDADYQPENVIPETTSPSRIPVNGSDENIIQENNACSNSINSPVANVSYARNPLAVDYHPESIITESTPPEMKQHVHITAEQHEEEKKQGQETGKRDIHQQMRWPASRGAKKRKKGNHKWMFILTGVMISAVSGYLMYTWITQSDKNDFVSSLESFSVETAEASVQAVYVNDNTEDTDFMADEIMDNEYFSEDALHEPGMMADLENDMDVIIETPTVSRTKSDFVSWNELDLTPVNENPAMPMKQPIENAKEITDAADDKKILIKEKLQESEDKKSKVIITKAAERKEPALSLKKGKKEKIEKLAQLLASSDISVHKKQTDLTGNVQSGNKHDVVKDRSYKEEVKAASGPAEQIRVTKKHSETAETNQVSVAKKLPGDAQKENPANEQKMVHPVKKEKNVTALHSNKKPVNAGIPALQASDLEQHEPVKTILVANALPQKKSGSSLNAHKDRQAGTTKKKEKSAIHAALTEKKGIIQTEGQKRREPVLLAQNKKSASETRSPNYQPVKNVALREMSVTYEDQFNDRNNHWPEYNNDRASVLIEEGEYHVEHKAKSGSHIVLHPYGVSNDMNYMIHIAISSVRGTGKNTYGFVFGGKDINNNYSFQIHSDSTYSIKKRLSGKEEVLAAGHIDNVFISKHSEKTLKIVKMQNKVRFYVDDYYLDELKNVEFNGDKVGFLVEGRVKISVDSTRTEIKFSSN